jgi:adenosylcobinamide-phosphate synthase
VLLNAAIAFGLDFLVGDPVFMLHPTRLIGGMLSRLEVFFRGIRRKTLGGGLLTAAALVAVGGLAAGATVGAVALSRAIGLPRLFQTPLLRGLYHPGFDPQGFNPLLALLAYFLFCNRDMIEEARAVFERLREGDLPGARGRLGRIVGRDTENLDQKAVIRATVETVSENIVDGFTSPFLYLLLGGLPLAYLFKTASTIDSMFGYRNERYEKFGKIGARLDDALNFVPARLNILFMLIATGFSSNLWRGVLRSGRAHPSPNSGIAESAFAGHLGLALGGPSVYGGIEKVKPWLGEDRLSESERSDPRLILRATRLYARVVIVTFLIVCASAAACTFAACSPTKTAAGIGVFGLIRIFTTH